METYRTLDDAKKAKKNWIQGAVKSIEKRGTVGKCTGAKFGSKTCPAGSGAYNLAKVFKGMSKKKKNK